MSFQVTLLNFLGSRETTVISAASFTVDNTAATGLILFWSAAGGTGTLVAYFPSGRVESVIEVGVGTPTLSPAPVVLGQHITPSLPLTPSLPPNTIIVNSPNS